MEFNLLLSLPIEKPGMQQHHWLHDEQGIHYFFAARTACAADSISLVTSSGWETIATWLDATSTAVAPIRLANKRSTSGGIASSFLATMYHDGSDFHAGVPIFSPSALADNGCCTAYMILA